MKDLFEYKLYCGDCLLKMKEIPNDSVDMVLCDLPYQQTQNTWDIQVPLQPLWDEYKRVCKRTSAIILFGQGMFSAKLMLSNERMWRYNLIWEKTQPTGFLNANKMPMRNHEDILVFYEKLPHYTPIKTYGHVRKVSTTNHKRNCKHTTNYGDYNFSSYDSTERYPLSILKFSKDTQKESYTATQKPVALCEYLIKSYSRKGDTVLDNTMGSASVGIACFNTQRKFIGIEKDEKTFSIAQKRIHDRIKMGLQLDILEGD